MVKNIDDLVDEIKTYYNPMTGKIEKISKRQALEMTEDIMTKNLNEIDSIQLKIDAGFIFEDYIKYEVEGGFLYFNKLTGSVDWCDINATRVIIPEKINNVNVTSIGEVNEKNKSFGAFSGNKALREVFIPKTIKKINDYAFYDCLALKKVDIEYGVKYIGKYAFYNANLELSDFNLPKSISYIGKNAFGNESIL